MINKKIILSIVLCFVLLNLASASSVTRSFSKTTLTPGESFSVTLNVAVSGGDTFYAIDEILPSTLWTINNNGGGDTTQTGHLKWIVISGATSTSYTYTLTALTTSGVYTFSGTYGFESLGSSTPAISGANQITISSSSSPTILINEFESNPAGTDSGNEWVELYNPNSFAVNLTNWKLYDGLTSPSLIKNLSTTINANSYYVYELTATKLNNADEFVTLKDSSDNLIDETSTLAESTATSKTWQRIPNGVDTNTDGDWQFLENTKGYANGNVSQPPTQSDATDDLMVNYVRGKINIGTEVAPAGTTFTIEILDGTNKGYKYSGIVDDSKIFSSLRGNGYFDTSDQIGFNTGAKFRVNVTSEKKCSANGTFQNGGNGNFNTLENLLIVNCEKNVAPVLSFIGDKTINEGENLTIQLTATDTNHDALRYYTNANFGSLNSTTGLFKWNINYVSSGDYNFVFNVTDGEFWDEEIANIKVVNKPVAPVINSFSPTGKILTTEDSDITFSVNWTDPDAQGTITTKWFVDGVLVVSDTNSYTNNGNGNNGTFNVMFIIEDDVLHNSKNWTLVRSKFPITEKYNGETTNFSELDETELDCVQNLILERIFHGKIEFLNCVDMNDIVDLDSYTEILNGLIGVDSNFFQALKNIPAKVTFYKLGFKKTPTIYYNDDFTFNKNNVNQICPENICENISYDAVLGKLSFNVPTFSTFVLKAQQNCSQQNGFICSSKETCKGVNLLAEDCDLCCSIKCIPGFKDIKTCEQPDSTIALDIENPDDEDDFEVGETIKGEVNIENNFDEKKEFKLKVVLYDLSDDKEIETFKQDVKLKSSKDETIEFEIQTPEDLDEENDYYIYVKAEDEDNETICNEEYIKINFEIPEEKVVISDVKITPTSVYEGYEIAVETTLENIGEDDVQGKIKIEIIGLNISTQSETFEIEGKDSDDDKIAKRLYLKIPEDTKKGIYNLRVSSLFAEGDFIDEQIEILENIPSSPENRNLIILGEKNLITEEQLQNQAIKLTGKTTSKIDTILSTGKIIKQDNVEINVELKNGKKNIFKNLTGLGDLYVKITKGNIFAGEGENGVEKSNAIYYLIAGIFIVGILIIGVLILKRR